MSSIKPEVHNASQQRQRTTQPRPVATGDLHKKFCEDRSSAFRDTLADRQTHTDRQTHRQTDRNKLLPCRCGVIGVNAQSPDQLFSRWPSAYGLPGSTVDWLFLATNETHLSLWLLSTLVLCPPFINLFHQIYFNQGVKYSIETSL